MEEHVGMYLKRAKEEFVSNLSGSSKLEIFALIACMPCLLHLANLIDGLASARGPPLTFMHVAVVEVSVAILPQVLLYMGVLNPYIAILLLSSLVVLPAVLALKQKISSEPITYSMDASNVAQTSNSFKTVGGSNTVQASNPINTVSGSGRHPRYLTAAALSLQLKVLLAIRDLGELRKTYVSVFRGGLMLSTCIAILAVDFHAFPRRYAKTETSGTALMDFGVGAIIFAGGLVSWNLHTTQSSLPKRINAGLRSAAPSLVLWLGRAVSLKAVDYQEHVGEYGVHWNFFATIAVIVLLGNLVCVRPSQLVLAGVLVTAAHQALLSSGVEAWVSSSERGSSLWELNKEGIGSCLGFWALHIWGATIGYLLHCTSQAVRDIAFAEIGELLSRGDGEPQGGTSNQESGEQEGLEVHGRVENQNRPCLKPGEKTGEQAMSTTGTGSGRSGTGELWTLLLRWFSAACVLNATLWLALLASESMWQVSRRSCNAPYIVWIVTLSLSVLLMLLAAQVLLPISLEALLQWRGATGSQNNLNLNLNCYLFFQPTQGCSPSSKSKSPPAIPTESSDTGSILSNGKGQKGSSPVRGRDLYDLYAGALAQERGSQLTVAANRQMLPLFLLANLLTGAVNMGMNTLSVGNWAARGVVVGYMVMVCASAILLDQSGLKLKFKR